MILTYKTKQRVCAVIPVNQTKKKYEAYSSGGGGNVGSFGTVQPVQQIYTTANVTPDRSLDPTTAILGEVAQVLATLIEDLKTSNIIQ